MMVPLQHPELGTVTVFFRMAAIKHPVVSVMQAMFPVAHGLNKHQETARHKSRADLSSDLCISCNKNCKNLA